MAALNLQGKRVWITQADAFMGPVLCDVFAAHEDAEFAAYLCSDLANCFVGQVFPVCGGCVTR